MAEEPTYAARQEYGDGQGPGEGPAAISERRDFAIQLTLLRERAGLTVRAVARSLDARDATIGGYFGGAHLPSVNLLPHLLAACGVTDPEAVREWTEALIRVRPRRGRTVGAAPYRGLASFEPEHSEWFFGREELTALLRRRLAEREAAGQALIVAVGPSGSGKSSLLRAGLVPTLLDEGRRVELLTPGPHPLTDLAARLAMDAPATVARTVAALSTDPEGRPSLVREPLVLVVDQFEETFTTCLDEAERQAFVTALCALAGGRAQVVLGLRADFYADALRYPPLAATLQDAQVVVGPMARAELRRAIAEPALKAGLTLPDGLVELVLSELAPPTGGAAREAVDTANAADVAHEAGALPLLSHALLATFRRSRDRRLTVSDYRDSGGIAGAVAHTAEAICSELTSEQLDLTRRLFLRLVRVSEDSADTRRRVWRSEVLAPGAGDELADIVDRFIDQRLITAHADTLELTHEALLIAWPRLRAWIDADRTGIRVHRRLTEAAQTWHDAGRDLHALPRGGPLAMFRDWATDPSHQLDLNRLEREFLDAGIQHDQQEKLSVRRRTLVLKGLVAALTVLAMVAGSLAVYAFKESENAREQSAAAHYQQALAVSREVAIEADHARSGDVALAAQLSLAAYRISPTPQARSSLLDSSATPSATRLLGPNGAVQTLAIDPRTHVLAAGCADGTVWLWDATQAARPRLLGKLLTAFRTKTTASGDAMFGTAVFAVALSSDGRTLAAAGADRTVWLWDLTHPAAPRALGKPLTGSGNTIYSLAFSPDGRTLAAGSADNTVRLWDVSDRERPTMINPLRGAADYVEAVAFSPDGRTLAAGSADRTVRLWDLSRPDTPRALGKPLAGPTGVVDALAFGPGGRTLAEADRNGSVWLWNITGAGRPAAGKALTGATSWVNAVAFSPDGRTLAAGGSDDLVRLWDVDTGRVTATLPHPGPVTSLAWRDSTTLVTGDADAETRLWHLPSPVLAATGVVNGVAFSPDGHLLAVAADRLQLWDVTTRQPVGPSLGMPGANAAAVAFSPDGTTLAVGSTDSRLRLWNITDPARPVSLGPPLVGPASGYVESVAYSRDGHTLATGNDDGTVRLWDVSDVTRPRPLGKPLTGPQSYVFSVAFSPDGRTLAAGSADRTVRLWDLTNRAAPSALGRPITADDTFYSVAFSPDGRTLAAGSADKKVRLWDLARRAQPRPLGPPLTGPDNYVYAIAFSPDGRTLAAGSTDHTTWLWDVSRPSTPVVLATLTGPTDHVYAVAFSPDGRTLAAGGADRAVRLWATDPAAVGKQVCALTGSSLTRAEWHQYIQDNSYEAVCGS